MSDAQARQRNGAAIVFLDQTWHAHQFIFLKDRLRSIELLRRFPGRLAAHVGVPKPHGADEISMLNYYALSDFDLVRSDLGRHNDFPTDALIVEEDERMQNTRFSRNSHV